jgi:hypothetical protein
MSKLMRAVASLQMVLALSCGPRGDTQKPGGDGGAGTKVQKGAGVELRYAMAPAKLVQTGKFDMSTTGGGVFGEAQLEYTAKLELAPQGEQLKVSWAFANIGKLDAKGMFETKPSEDAKGLLVKEGKGAFLIDARGQTDEETSLGLPENAARRKRFEEIDKLARSGKAPKMSGGEQMLAMVEAIIVIPDLPEQGLEVGKTITIAMEEQTELGGTGMMLPTQKETKYTLVKIDESGGKRIAELQVVSASSGAAEEQGVTLTVDATNEGSMLFDLDAKLPVSYRFTRTQSLSDGQSTFESTMVLEANFATS